MCTVEAEKKSDKLETTCTALIFGTNFTIFFVSHLLSACEGGRPLLHRSHSLHILHQLNTIQMSTELFPRFCTQRSFSLPHREASSAHTNCSVWYEVQKCPSPNPLQLTQKRASWLHFTEQQSFSPSTPLLSSSPLLSSPLLSSPLPLFYTVKGGYRFWYPEWNSWSFIYSCVIQTCNLLFFFFFLWKLFVGSSIVGP